jgi:hypothetical protein
LFKAILVLEEWLFARELNYKKNAGTAEGH